MFPYRFARSVRCIGRWSCISSVMLPRRKRQGGPGIGGDEGRGRRLQRDGTGLRFTPGGAEKGEEKWKQQIPSRSGGKF